MFFGLTIIIIIIHIVLQCSPNRDMVITIEQF